MKVGPLFLFASAVSASASVVSFTNANFAVHYFDTTGATCGPGYSTQALFNSDTAVRAGPFVPLSEGQTVGSAITFIPAPFIQQGGLTIATTTYTCVLGGEPFFFPQWSITLYNEVAQDGFYPFSVQGGAGNGLSEGTHYGWYQLVTNPAYPGGGSSYVSRAWVEETAGVSAVVVPEPAAAVLLGTAALFSGGRRKRLPC